MPNIAVIIACYNRKCLTIRALQNLLRQTDCFKLKVFLFDDGSTDGTTEAVLAEFPDVVIIRGSGFSFWNEGMYKAWTRALEEKFDGYLWLNDDALIDEDAIERIYHSWINLGDRSDPLIIVGSMRSSNGNLSYGGLHRSFSPFALKFNIVPLSTEIQYADTFHGNLVFISSATVTKIGINDPKFFHTLGDVDYGLRASKAGIKIYVLPGTLGVCEHNDRDFSDLTIWQRLRRVNSHLGLPIASWYRMTRRWSGLWMPFHFILPYRKLFL